jgi:hypothetical protein
MDGRKHLDDKRFDLAFEAIEELYCHANTNVLVKATSEVQNIEMRPSNTLIEDALRNHVLLHGRDKVTTGLGTKFFFVEDNCCVEDKNKECMHLYGKAILINSLKESYLKNAVCDIPEYKFALMTDSHKMLHELLVKTDLNAGRNQKLKSSVTRTKSQ